MAASLRFEVGSNVHLNEFHWVIPRLHFYITGVAHLVNKLAIKENKKTLVDGYVRENYNSIEVKKNQIL